MREESQPFAYHERLEQRQFFIADISYLSGQQGYEHRISVKNLPDLKEAFSAWSSRMWALDNCFDDFVIRKVEIQGPSAQKITLVAPERGPYSDVGVETHRVFDAIRELELTH